MFGFVFSPIFIIFSFSSRIFMMVFLCHYECVVVVAPVTDFIPLQ